MKKLLYAVLTGCMAWSFISLAIHSSKSAAVENPGPLGIAKEVAHFEDPCPMGIAMIG